MRDRRLSDTLAIGACWLSGGLLVGAIVLVVGWLAWNGARTITVDFLTTNPSPGSLESGVAGGILAPLVGTLAMALIGGAIAVPLGVGTGVFLHEFARPRAFARVVDTSIDLIFGVPSVVLALFGVAAFTLPRMSFLSEQVVSSGRASGISYWCAGLVISLIALPPVVRSTQSALASVPRHRREASYALGKTRLATLRRVILPEARPGIATGVVLGVGRVVGDTAIIILLMGGLVLQPPEPGWLAPGQLGDTLRGGGSTLTSYVFYAAPTGEGNSPQQAYGAALVLVVVMLVINAVVLAVGRRRRTRA